jgi:hypothetical protein
MVDQATGRQARFHEWHAYLAQSDVHYCSALERAVVALNGSRPELKDAILDMILLLYRPDDEYAMAMNPPLEVIPLEDR